MSKGTQGLWMTPTIEKAVIVLTTAGAILALAISGASLVRAFLL